MKFACFSSALLSIILEHRNTANAVHLDGPQSQVSPLWYAQQDAASETADGWSQITQGPTADSGNGLSQSSSQGENTVALPIVSPSEMSEYAAVDSEVDTCSEESESDSEEPKSDNKAKGNDDGKKKEN